MNEFPFRMENSIFSRRMINTNEVSGEIGRKVHQEWK